MTGQRELLAAVTGLQGGGSPCPGVSVVKSLLSCATPLEIIGLDYHALATGLYLNHNRQGALRAARLLPRLDRRDDLLARFQELVSEFGPFVLLPTLDVEQPIFASLQVELRSIGVSTLLPEPKAIVDRSKRWLGKLAAEIGDVARFRVPATRAIETSEELESALLTITYPAFVKGRFCGAHLVETPPAARFYSRRLTETWGWPLLIQEPVAGDEYCVVMLFDRRSRPAGHAVMKKLAVTEAGKAWAAVTVADGTFAAVAAQIGERLAWRGPLEIDMIQEAEDRLPVVLEVNPRFPTWTYLAAMAGCNLPERAVALASERAAADVKPFVAGVVSIRYFEDVFLPFEEFLNLASEQTLMVGENEPADCTHLSDGTETEV